jgi:8-oxo-dGTP pyrophosphatase MutT (NUDIX family)
VREGKDRIARVLASHQLPKGFPQGFHPPDSSVPAPLPSATLVLLREGTEGLETLLLQRSSRSRFIPGAYVFPGGRIDPEDADPTLWEQLGGLDAGRLRGQPAQGGNDPPHLAFIAAALREAFEETGILLTRGAELSAPLPEMPTDRPELVRGDLLEGRISFREALNRLGAVLDADTLVYFANWVTPESEPRRFDTRFFAAQISPDATVSPFSGEVARALWVSPEEALRRNAEGSLPLVFPTLHTLEVLRSFSTPSAALQSLAGVKVRKRLPKLVPVPGGVGVVLGP